ncbi:hypothetical protein EVAR_70933_1 [Eumeta japonica]|uniref:Uncharacterized protein n=1 Tax=Eumeta variegata TaxID=151549 RepID=A0A4C1SWN3_EUMVA|nr:hypothetical protein EVAR_70933_1 [Eumeta japonica]
MEDGKRCRNQSVVADTSDGEIQGSDSETENNSLEDKVQSDAEDYEVSAPPEVNPLDTPWMETMQQMVALPTNVKEKIGALFRDPNRIQDRDRNEERGRDHFLIKKISAVCESSLHGYGFLRDNFIRIESKPGSVSISRPESESRKDRDWDHDRQSIGGYENERVHSMSVRVEQRPKASTLKATNGLTQETRRETALQD